MSQATATRPRTAAPLRAPARRRTLSAVPAAATTRAAAVSPVAGRSLGSAGFAMLCIGLLVAGLVGVLLINTARAQQSYTLSSLQRQNSIYTGSIEELNTDIDALSAPQQIAQAAQKQGLGPALHVRYVDKATGKVLGASKSTALQAPFTVGTLPTTPASLVAGSAVAAASQGIIVQQPKPTTVPTPAKPASKSPAAVSPRATPSATATGQATAKPSARTPAGAAAAPSTKNSPSTAATSAPHGKATHQPTSAPTAPTTAKPTR